MRINFQQYAVPAGLWLCSLAAASATTLVTFQVDMTMASFAPSIGDRVQLRGSLSELGAWGQGPWLTNSANPANPNLFSATVAFAEAVGAQVQYKYAIIPAGDSNYGDWSDAESNIPGSGNRLFQLAGGTQNLPFDYWSNLDPNIPATSPVTFQLDMTAQVQVGRFNPGNGDTVQVRGQSSAIGGWGVGPLLTNNPSASNSNLYTGTFDFTDCDGYTELYKFVIVTNGDTPGSWNNGENLSGNDSNGNNRFFSLLEGGLTLPPVYFNDVAPGPAPLTVAVTFEVDMSAQILTGVFTPGVDTAGLAGSFNGWSAINTPLTNNPNAANPNIYSTVLDIYDFPSATEQYKFICYGPTINGTDWENPTGPTIGGNRYFLLGTNATVVLPVVFFSDEHVSDFLTTDTLVTFSVSMTNAIGTDAVVFNPAVDNVFLNGVFGNWWVWGSTPPQWEMTNNPDGSEIYSLQVLYPAGTSLIVTYKYGINSSDDEAAENDNHVRYIRTLGNYVMPLDVFGNQYVETSFGNLTATPSPGGNVLVSWLGRPGVRLQTETSLNPGAWLEHPETDGLSSTNWPATGAGLFFRLVKH